GAARHAGPVFLGDGDEALCSKTGTRGVSMGSILHATPSNAQDAVSRQRSGTHGPTFMKRLFLLALLLSPTTLRADEPAPSYTRDVKPFLEKYCTECHNSNNAKAGVRLENYDDLFRASKKGRKLLVASKPDDSRLLHTMEGKAKQMPP